MTAGTGPSTPTGTHVPRTAAAIDSLLTERRVFPPSADFVEQANAGEELYDEARWDRLAFWEAEAARLDWTERWDQVLDWSQPPVARWFCNARLNVAVNCVDRHVDSGHGTQVALHWIGEPGDTRDITYADLLREVSQAANALEALGVQPGDRVVIQLPMIPEAIVSMLACARIGAVHSVVFGGFSATALRARVDDAGARIVITSDGQFRRGQAAPMKDQVDEALLDAADVEHILVVRRTGAAVSMQPGRDQWWHDLVSMASTEHRAASFDSEHPLFILYTSGTTGKPKGILHTSGGYLTQAAYTHRVVLDQKPDSDVYWCTADIGWITGHSYVVYGPLANRTTQVIYEGTPNTPHQGRHFEIIEQYGVTTYYSAPTLIRTFMRWGEHLPAGYDLSSIRLLGSVGEPINPEAWIWYRKHIGGDRAPIVDTWWQTETGAIMVAPLPGVIAAKPGSAQRAVPGVSVQIVDELGERQRSGGSGYIVIDQPWPSMTRGIWGDPARTEEVYWARFKDQGYYFAGDGARYDPDGDIWLLGRVDDVMNVSGHRISTMEIESALVSHLAVAEAAVVGAADATTGQSIVAFVVLKASIEELGDNLVQAIAELSHHVVTEIGPIARPRRILVVAELPKTRSGKIMRRLLRDVAENREMGDASTLADPATMQAIMSGFTHRHIVAGDGH